jgi:predicted HicB family RNase H-like nuclease
MLKLEDKPVRKKRKQINFYLPEEWHHEIKVRSARRNISITDWILQAIYSKANSEKQYE